MEEEESWNRLARTVTGIVLSARCTAAEAGNTSALPNRRETTRADMDIQAMDMNMSVADAMKAPVPYNC